MNKDYYEILGVEKTATKDEIKKKFRLLAKQYHPDISKEENAEEKFKEIQEAYAVLSDENKKAQYDQFGHSSYNNSSHQNYSSYSNYRYYGGDSSVFTPFSVKDWFLKKTFIEKIFFLIMGVALAFLIVIVGIFLLMIAGIALAIYIIVKIIKLIIKTLGVK